MTTYDVNRFGHIAPVADVTGMMSPVRCRCGRVYDLTKVKVTGRYADCTVFETPCCKRQADDRTWKSMPDFTRLDNDGREVQR